MSQALCFDFGMKYIGVATGQVITKTTTPLKSIKAKDGIPNWEDIDELISSWAPKDVVVGLPLNMDGSEQLMSKRARKFANRIQDRYKQVKVHLVDERLTSWEARHDVDNNDFDALNAKAAAIILEQWLNTNS